MGWLQPQNEQYQYGYIGYLSEFVCIRIDVNFIFNCNKHLSLVSIILCIIFLYLLETYSGIFEQTEDIIICLFVCVYIVFHSNLCKFGCCGNVRHSNGFVASVLVQCQLHCNAFSPALALDDGHSHTQLILV